MSSIMPGANFGASLPTISTISLCFSPIVRDFFIVCSMSFRLGLSVVVIAGFFFYWELAANLIPQSFVNIDAFPTTCLAVVHQQDGMFCVIRYDDA